MLSRFFRDAYGTNKPRPAETAAEAPSWQHSLIATEGYESGTQEGETCFDERR